MDKYLVAVGCQKEKLDYVDKRTARKIVDYINGYGDQYAGIISVIRKKKDNDNFNRLRDDIATDTTTYLDYESDSVIEVSGYDVDCTKFRSDVSYDIIGVSAGASVLCTAMSMYSAGLRINVLGQYVADRKGDKIKASAFNIMNAYMPGVLI